MPRKYIDITELARRYVAGESVQQLAIAYNYTPSGIRYALHRQGTTTHRERFEITDAELRKLYFADRLTTYEIAERLGCSPHIVWDRMRSYGIQSLASNRNRRIGITEVTLRKLYLDEQLSTNDIAMRLSCSSAIIHKYLHSFGIPVRTITESLRVPTTATRLHKRFANVAACTKPYYAYTLIALDDPYIQMASVRIPSRTGYRRVSTHRLTMAKSLGRCLEPWEIVHHRDRNPMNNNIDNLELVTRTSHLVYTFMQCEIDVLRKRVTILEAELVAIQAQNNVEVI